MASKESSFAREGRKAAACEALAQTHWLLLHFRLDRGKSDPVDCSCLTAPASRVSPMTMTMTITLHRPCPCLFSLSPLQERKSHSSCFFSSASPSPRCIPTSRPQLSRSWRLNLTRGTAAGCMLFCPLYLASFACRETLLHCTALHRTGEFTRRSLQPCSRTAMSTTMSTVVRLQTRLNPWLASSRPSTLRRLTWRKRREGPHPWTLAAGVDMHSAARAAVGLG